MTANELADNISLDNCHLNHADRLNLATMLRQQAQEIEQLKKQLMRELTDEEIWECHDKTNTDNWVIDFARAILKKASEK